MYTDTLQIPKPSNRSVDNKLLLVFLSLGVLGITSMPFFLPGIPEMKLRAIETGKAYYHPQTAEFTWSDNVTKYIITGGK